MSREDADQLILKLFTMSSDELKQLWAALFGTVCYTNRKDFIRRRLEWRINTLVSGGLSERAMKRVEDIADDTLIRVKSRAFSPRQPKRQKSSKPTVIRKKYKGTLYEVIQYPDHFLYNGKKYRTISEVSTEIAGYYVSGNRFFGLPSTSRV